MGGAEDIILQNAYGFVKIKCFDTNRLHIQYIYIYTSGAIFPMLVQVVYIAYTPLCRWYMKHIHQFAKQPSFSIVSE